MKAETLRKLWADAARESRGHRNYTRYTCIRISGEESFRYNLAGMSLKALDDAQPNTLRWFGPQVSTIDDLEWWAAEDTDKVLMEAYDITKETLTTLIQMDLDQEPLSQTLEVLLQAPYTRP